MVTIARTTDPEGRVSLPEAFANMTVIIEQISDTELRIRKAQIISENRPPAANEALRRAAAASKKAAARAKSNRHG